MEVTAEEEVIQIAKECGARIDDEELNYRLGGSACIFTIDELMEYTYRIRKNTLGGILPEIRHA